MKIAAVFLGLTLAGCATGNSQSMLMQASTVRPPPLPVADLEAGRTAPKPNITIKRQSAPPPLPQARPVIPSSPVPAPVPVEPPPHHWYDHLKFWQK